MKVMIMLAPALVMACASPAQTGAQTGGGLQSLLRGGALPSLSGAGVGNLAGVLSYCVQNQLLGATGATAGGSGLLGGIAGAGETARPSAAEQAAAPSEAASAAPGVLDRLLGRQGIRNSPGYAAGRSGRLQLGGRSTLPLSGLQDQLKSRLCSAVFDRARSFL